MKTREPVDDPIPYGWMDMSVPSKKLLETTCPAGGIQAIHRKNYKGTGTNSDHRLDAHVTPIEETTGDDVLSRWYSGKRKG
jgi:hypothetical protein